MLAGAAPFPCGGEVCVGEDEGRLGTGGAAGDAACLLVVVSGRVVHSRVVDLAADTLIYESGLEFINPSLHAQNALRALLLRLNAGDGPV